VEKPSAVQTVGICLLIGGIFAILTSLGILASTVCLWLPGIFGLVAGILAIVKASRLMGEGAYGSGMPTTPAVMLIVNVINFDMIGLAMGIITLVMSQDPKVRNYLEGVEILD